MKGGLTSNLSDSVSCLSYHDWDIFSNITQNKGNKKFIFVY